MNFFVYTVSVLVKKVKTVVTAASIFRFSYSKCGRTTDLAIAFWNKQIVLCPYINDNNKGWCKEFAETKVEKNKKTMKTVKNKKIVYICTVV
ncbi:MAG: hypothetical protein IJQ99_05820 [Synergistaceae bacterium]|nr:hypothetical protein [Synergistaceae bacterium]